MAAREMGAGDHLHYRQANSSGLGKERAPGVTLGASLGMSHARVWAQVFEN